MIRPMKPIDCNRIEMIETEKFTTTLDCRWLLSMLGKPNFCGFVDDLDHMSDLAGYLIATIAADEAEILSIAVTANNQRLGCGNGLLTHFLAYAGKKNIKTVVLEVAADNGAALALYCRHGFKQFGQRTNYYKRRAGYCDAIMMKCSPDEAFP